MVLVSKNGLMELSTKVNGKTTKLRERVNLFIQMVIIIKEIGQMIKLMDMEFMFTARQEQDMKATGKMICNMDQEWKFIVMVISMKVCLNKEKEMDRGLTIILQVKFIKEVGSMEELKVLVYVNGQIKRNIKVNGKIIKNMDKVFIHGLMEEDMKATIEMIRSMVKVHTHGLIKDSTLVNGKMTKDMVKVCT